MAAVINFFNFVIHAQAGKGEGKIAYKNIFKNYGAIVTASDAASGYPVENIHDWKQYDWWKQNAIGTSYINLELTSAVSADYFAIFGHNLHSAVANYKLQYSYNNSTWYDATNTEYPTSNKVILKIFDTQSAKYWRVAIVSMSAQVAIAGLMLGITMDFERDLTSGFAPPNLAPEVDSKVPMSEKGINLGASIIRTGIKGNIQISNLTEGFVRAEWVPLIEHLNLGLPAVFCWDTTNRIEDTVLIWRSGDIPAPSYISAKYMSVSLKFEGIQ